MDQPPKALYGLATCSWCQGSGKGRIQYDIDREGLMGCSACSGRGSVLVSQPGSPCAVCEGVGEDTKNPAERCMSCGGSGWARWIGLV